MMNMEAKNPTVQLTAYAIHPQANMHALQSVLCIACCTHLHRAHCGTTVLGGAHSRHQRALQGAARLVRIAHVVHAEGQAAGGALCTSGWARSMRQGPQLKSNCASQGTSYPATGPCPPPC